jgi:hypothetical protein
MKILLRLSLQQSVFIDLMSMTKNGKFLATKFCLINVGHTNFQLPTQLFDHNLKWPI